MNIRISMLLIALFVNGCATFPEKIKVEDTTQLVSYEDAASKAVQVKGRTVRWGGVVAKVENKPDFTVFEIVYYPLNGYGRPISDEESMGRFRMRVNGFMDPMVYQIGRLMTFTGELQSVEKGLVGEHEYVFPTASVNAYYLWKNIQRIDLIGVHGWPHQPWYGHYPRHYNHRFTIRSGSNRGSNTSSNHKVKSTRPNGATNYPKPVKTKRTKK